MDRITTLMKRFLHDVRICPPEEADFVVLGTASQPLEVRYYPRARGRLAASGNALWHAKVLWSSTDAPFQRALPDEVCFDLSTDSDGAALVQVILQEHNSTRCGRGLVLNRLGEVLLVRLMRDQIDRGLTEPGLIAGLSDPRISRALVAMHDRPGQSWSNQDLAEEAGMSLSRFNEVFAQLVGQTPISYLRQWRLTLAGQDLERGDRVEAVARRYAYGSPEAFTRAYRKAYGEAPIVRRKTLGSAA